MTLELVQSRVNLAVVESFGAFADRLEEQRLRIELGVNTKNVGDDTGSRPIVAATCDITVTDDEDKLPLVIVIQGCKGVDSSTERILPLRVTWHLADNELVLQFGRSARGKL